MWLVLVWWALVFFDISLGDSETMVLKKEWVATGDQMF
jgi:hypothetical protein